MARRASYGRCVELCYEDSAFDKPFIYRRVFGRLKERILSVARRSPTGRPLLLMGPGGSGKSTFVNWLVKEALRELRCQRAILRRVLRRALEEGFQSLSRVPMKAY